MKRFATGRVRSDKDMKPGYRIISDPRLIDTKQWALFSEKNQHGNIFHSPWMVTLYNNNNKVIPETLFCLNDKDAITGVLVAYIMRENKGVLSFLTSRAVIWGGPVVEDDDTDICCALVIEIRKRLKGIVNYIQIRNMRDTTAFKKMFGEAGFGFEDHLDILFNLREPVKVLWNGLHPTRRKQVNRALRRGLTTSVTMAASAKEVTTCYEILSNVYKSVRLPLPDLSIFIKAVEMNNNECRLGIIKALFEDQIIGFRFFLVYNGLIYDWYAASDEKHYEKYPNDILPWALIEWGCNNGYNTFDFGGAGNPHKRYGVRDYKLKFGGETVNFGRYLFVNRPVIYYSAKTILNLRERLIK